MFYDAKGQSNLLKNAGKGGMDAQNFRETFRGGMQGYNQPMQTQSAQASAKKSSNVRLEPISQNQLATGGTKVSEFSPEKASLKPSFNQQANLGTVVVSNSNIPMKGKGNNLCDCYLLILLAQLQPINHNGGNNPKTMKLSFKATLLINNDGSNAELQNMSSHVKGY